MSARNSCLLLLAAVCASAGLAQNQGVPSTVRDYCIKVAPGKSMEYEAFTKDVSVPLNQARADAGELAWYLVARGVIPAGSTAKCDYRVAFGYAGLPPDIASAEQLEAALKRAKLNLSAREFLAKRDSLSQLVAHEIWGQVDSIGPRTEKGNYVRLNHYKVKPGMTEDWTRLETTYWKPLVDAWVKGGAKTSWGVYQLWMPEGEDQPYNGMTVDIFSDWNSLLQGPPMDGLWQKVHPHTEATEVFDRLDRVRSRHDIEVYKVIELVGPAK